MHPQTRLSKNFLWNSSRLKVLYELKEIFNNQAILCLTDIFINVHACASSALKRLDLIRSSDVDVNIDTIQRINILFFVNGALFRGKGGPPVLE